MNTAADQLSEAALQDVDASSLKEAVPDLLAKDTPGYLVEYGIRIDDGAMVFHFFPPKDRGDWDPGWRMDTRLERALPGCFDVSAVSAGYAEELRSFYVIVGGLGSAPDPWPSVERFFAAIDSALAAEA